MFLESTEGLLQVFAEFQPEIASLKKTYGITNQDVEQLKVIGQEWLTCRQEKQAEKQYAELNQGMHFQEALVAEDWSSQADIDLGLLTDKIQFCTKIWDKVNNMFTNALVESGVVKKKDIRFAPPKAFARSLQKLTEYSEESQARLAKSGCTRPVSSVNMIKDILRGSVESDSPAQTQAIFSVLTNLPHMKVMLVKNGFADKNGKIFDAAE